VGGATKSSYPGLFPWANVCLHGETYDEPDFNLYESECVRVDNEGDRIVTETFEDWSIGRFVGGFPPYTVECDEVARWRLELTLNDLGAAFLRVDDYGISGG